MLSRPVICSTALLLACVSSQRERKGCRAKAGGDKTTSSTFPYPHQCELRVSTVAYCRTRKRPLTMSGEEDQTATAAGPHACPQPPYDEDFNPFSEKDRERILHEEECNDESEGWKFVSRTQYTEVWSKTDPTKPVHLIKGFLQFPGIPPNVVVDLINNTELRKEWDGFFDIIELVDEHKNFKVVYWMKKLPLTISDRDLVQFIRKEYDESTNTTYFLYRNATHPKYPERRGVVRAETILSGVVVRSDPQDPGSTRMSLMLQTDMKGWIPHMIVNAIAERSPRQWRDSLANFYTNVYSKKQQSAGDGGGGQEDGQE